MNRLAGKVALVTGGASGLGKAIARRLKSEGADVIITDILADLGQGVAAESGFSFIAQDVSDEQGWTSVMDEIASRHGRLDVAVNNAGILGPLHETPEKSSLSLWRRIFAVNVEGVFLGCRAQIQLMRRTGGGSIINISSAAGLVATPYATAYGASKAAVRHLTKSVAQHCAEEKLNIRCNSVHPGDVKTDTWMKQATEAATARGVTAEHILSEAMRVIPMGDLTRAEDIAAGVAYLASEDARHVTGTMLAIDGGVLNCETFLMGLKG